ncbi:MAG: isoprenylcysteine carboxylmethyltransferase family protein, partial [Hyphomicrobiaceae bacterium]
MSNDPYDRPSSIPWPPILFAGALAAGWLLGRILPLRWPSLDDVASRIVGYGFGLAGLALAAWALITFIRAGANIRPDRAAGTLVTSGPYSRFRNPMYLSEVFML